MSLHSWVKFIAVMQLGLLSVAGINRPHIVTIIADDLGWNDVSFHGSNQIPTPNIDALAYNGVILNRHYTMPTCTPSRTAFLTGKYPIRTGMQGFPLMADEPRGLPLSEVILPERLQQLGYATRLIGKWHQGSYKSEYTPTSRGFDSFLGYWNGYIGYFTHTNKETGYPGFDFHRDHRITRDYVGRYATDVFTEEAENIINNHNTTQPLYLHLAHLAVHTGNDDDPLEVPDVEEAHRKFSYISSPERRLFAEMVTKLDESVGKVVTALSHRGMLNNTIVVFMSDNGAQTQGMFANHGSNWPLRGLKFTPHEGGVRGVAAIWNSGFLELGRVSSQLFHLTDWLPTLYSAAGGDVSDLGDIDGIDQWASLVNKKVENPRTQVLINIDVKENVDALIDERWKISKGDFKNAVYDGYFGENGLGPEVPEYNISAIINSEVNKAIESIDSGLIHNSVLKTIAEINIEELRSRATIRCTQRYVEGGNETEVNKPRHCSDYCLYDLHEDPCEMINVAADHEDVVDQLVHMLNQFKLETVPQINRPPDPAADPRLHNDTWVSWLDDPASNPDHCSRDNQVEDFALRQTSDAICINNFDVLLLFVLAMHLKLQRMMH